PTRSGSRSPRCDSGWASHPSSPRSPGWATASRRTAVDRAPGLSARLKLALSYAGFLVLAGVLLLAAVWAFLLRYVPEQALLVDPEGDLPGPFPVRSALLGAFAPRAA